MRRKKKIREIKLHHPFRGEYFYKEEPEVDIVFQLFRFEIFALHIGILDGQYWLGVLGFGIFIEYY